MGRVVVPNRVISRLEVEREGSGNFRMSLVLPVIVTVIEKIPSFYGYRYRLIREEQV